MCDDRVADEVVADGIVVAVFSIEIHDGSLTLFAEFQKNHLSIEFITISFAKLK